MASAVLLPLLYYVYESKESPIFSSCLSRWVVSILLVLGGAGVTAIIALIVRVLEDHSKLKVVMLLFVVE